MSSSPLKNCVEAEPRFEDKFVGGRGTNWITLHGLLAVIQQWNTYFTVAGFDCVDKSVPEPQCSYNILAGLLALFR